MMFEDEYYYIFFIIKILIGAIRKNHCFFELNGADEREQIVHLRRDLIENRLSGN